MKVPAILLDCDLRNIEGIIYSFGKRAIPLIGLSSTEQPPAFRSKYFQKKLLSPPISKEKEYLDFLIGMEERGVLVYSDDGSAEFISKYQEVLKQEGFLVNISDLETFKRGFDKDKVFVECRDAGIPTIKTLRIQAREELENAWQNLGTPLLLKPTRLAGGNYVIVRHKEDLKASYDRMLAIIREARCEFKKSGVIAQEFIAFNYDDLYCCETYYSQDFKPSGFLTIRKVRPDINRDGTPGSRLYAGITEQNERIELNTRRLLEHLNWKGFAHVEWIYSAKYDDYLLCEINPRLPGFSNYLTKIGFEIAWHYYADLTGLSYEKPQFKKSLYFEALRVPGDLTNSLFSIINGHLSLSGFLRSYLRAFNRDYQVCFDVFFKKDPAFTLTYWFKFLKYVLFRPFKEWRRKHSYHTGMLKKAKNG